MASEPRVRFVCVALAMTAWVAPVHAQDTGALRAEAEAEYARGTRLFEAGRYEEALATFRSSISKFASPNARLAIARALVELGRLPDAIVEYELTIAEADRLEPAQRVYARTRAAAEAELRAGLARVARVRLRFDPPPGARLSVNGRDVALGSLDRPTMVTPGSILIDVSAPGHAPRQIRTSAGAGQEVVLEIVLTAIPERTAVRSESERPAGTWRPLVRTLGWVGVAAAAAGLAGAGVFYLLAAAQHDTFVSECLDAVCPAARRDDLATTGRTLELGTNVSLVSALALGAAGVTLLVVSLGGSEAAEARVRPALGALSLELALR